MLLSDVIQFIFTLPLFLMLIVVYPIFGLMMVVCIIMKIFNEPFSIKIFNKTEFLLQADSPAFYYSMISVFMIWLFYLLLFFKIINNETFSMIVGVTSLVSLWYFVYVVDYHLYEYKERKTK